MALEIERRFLVKPEYYQYLKGIKGHSIIQGYVSEPHDSLALRVRASTSWELVSNYFLTIKRKDSHGINREFETSIGLVMFEELLAECRGRVLKKLRKFHPENGLLFEIDFFKNALDGIVIAEVELKDINQPITLPDFIGKEITGIEGVSNFDMAINPKKAREILCQLN